jgi:hypothetical protein
VCVESGRASSGCSPTIRKAAPYLHTSSATSAGPPLCAPRPPITRSPSLHVSNERPWRPSSRWSCSAVRWGRRRCNGRWTARSRSCSTRPPACCGPSGMPPLLPHGTPPPPPPPPRRRRRPLRREVRARGMRSGRRPPKISRASCTTPRAPPTTTTTARTTKKTMTTARMRTTTSKGGIQRKVVRAAVATTTAAGAAAAGGVRSVRGSEAGGGPCETVCSGAATPFPSTCSTAPSVTAKVVAVAATAAAAAAAAAARVAAAAAAATRAAGARRRRRVGSWGRLFWGTL